MKLGPAFTSDLADALLDAAIEQAMAPGGPVEAAIEHSHDVLRSVGQANDYHVDSIIDALQAPTVTRRSGGFQIRWGWDHDAAPFFEWGTPDNYTIDGNPILSFVWENPPSWVREAFEPEGDGYRVFFRSVDSGRGIEESRFVREGIASLRRHYQ